MTSQPSHIRDLQRKSLREVTGNRKIECPGIRSFQRLINSPSDGLAEGRRRLGEGTGRRRFEEYIPELVHRGNLVDVGNARHSSGIVVGASGNTTLSGKRKISWAATGVLHRCGQPAGCVRVERAKQLHAGAVINSTEAAPNYGLIVIANQTP